MPKSPKDRLIEHLETALLVERDRVEGLLDQVRVLNDRVVLLTDKYAYKLTSVNEPLAEPHQYIGGGRDMYEAVDQFGQRILVDNPPEEKGDLISLRSDDHEPNLPTLQDGERVFSQHNNDLLGSGPKIKDYKDSIK